MGLRRFRARRYRGDRAGWRRATPGIRIHRTRWLHPDDASSHCQIRVTSPARTLVDLAGVVAARQLELAFEEGLRSGVVSPEALREQVEKYVGRRGVPVLRDLLDLDPSNLAKTKSRLEGRFLRFCQVEGLPAPQVNAWVGGYEVDMSWPGTNVVVALDSWGFHSGRGPFERDRAKWADLTAKGYRVIVITHRRLTSERPKVAEIHRSLIG